MASDRATSILQHIDEIVSAAVGALPFALPAAIGAISATTNTLLRSRMQQRATAEKIQQSGLGAEYHQAKRDVSQLRRQHYLGLHSPQQASEIKQKLLAAKAHLKDVENRGLHQYHATLAQNPVQHQQVKRQELTTTHQ
jgi:hypothetical protein